MLEIICISIVFGIPALGMLAWIYSVYLESGFIAGLSAAMVLAICLSAGFYLVYVGKSHDDNGRIEQEILKSE
jgi:hypothetical protein